MVVRRVAAVAVLLLAGSARAEEAWKVVTIAGRPDFTIEMPAAVDPAGDLPQDTLFAFAAAAGDEHLVCSLHQQSYSDDMPRNELVDALGGDERTTFCTPSDPAATNAKTLESAKAVRSEPAGICAASYAKARDQLPGRIKSALAIAANDAIYVFDCSLGGANQESVEESWTLRWRDAVHHMQTSLKLPAK